jgi:SAM-dependent methyltransferase
MAQEHDLYEDYHTNMPFHNFGQFTNQTAKAIFIYPDARRVLDFGCGNGLAVRQMREQGREWYGVELSAIAFERDLREPWFFHGGASQFGDGSFDLVYSTEVLEHIPESDVDSVVGDLCRICASYIFMTISLRPSSQNNRFHCTLRSRAWWESKFVANGFEVERKVVNCFQRRSLKSTRAILRKWADHGPEPARFAENPPYRLYGESEFWCFAFRRRGLPPTKPARNQQRWAQRNLIPLIHKLTPFDRLALW